MSQLGIGQKISLSHLFSVSEDHSSTIDYMLAPSDLTRFPHFMITSDAKNGTRFEFYDNLQDNTPQFFLNAKGFSRLRSFVIGDQFYTFQEKLYKINMKTFNTDSVELDRSDYLTLSLFSLAEETLLVASSRRQVHIYSLADLSLKYSVERKEERQFDLPIIIEELLLFQNQNNELAVYDLNNSKIIQRFNSGEKPAYFIGIKIGSFNDIISWYRASIMDTKVYLYYTTFSGAVNCVEAKSGMVIGHKEQFRGKKNNAGLISSFSIHDTNFDRIPDLIGASVDQNIYCIDGKTLELLWYCDTGHENQLPLSFFDIDKDGVPEIFGVNDAMSITILSGKDGKVLLRQRLSQNMFQTGVSLGDLNGNGLLDLIIRSDRKTIQVYQCDSVKVNEGELIWVSKL